MAFDFARLNAELEAKMTPAQRERLRALEAREAYREANTVYIDGVERFHFHDGSLSYERTRPVGFVVEPSEIDPTVYHLVCTNGVTGYERWELRGVRQCLDRSVQDGHANFYVCAGTDGRYASLRVRIRDVLDCVISPPTRH